MKTIFYSTYHRFLLITCLAIATASCSTYLQDTFFKDSKSPVYHPKSTSQSKVLKSLTKEKHVQVIEQGQLVQLIIPSDLLFPFNQTEHLTVQARLILNKIAHLIKQYPPTAHIIINAFTDNVGSQLAKKEQTSRQATNIGAYLWNQGINQYQMTISGRSDQLPIASNRTGIEAAKNRRIEISIW